MSFKEEKYKKIENIEKEENENEEEEEEEEESEEDENKINSVKKSTNTYPKLLDNFNFNNDENIFNEILEYLINQYLI